MLRITAAWDPWRPYDWWLPGPPWGSAAPADAYLWAHPPGFLAWVWAWRHLSEDVATLRRLAALPWALLLGWAAGRLSDLGAGRRERWGPAALWLSAPVTALGLQRGLMPDLQTVALGGAAVALMAGEEAGVKRQILAGLCFAGAVWTKYPALLLAPALLALAPLATRRALWITALGALALGEGWLALRYGRLHPVEVLAHAAEIPRSGLGERGLGLLVRLGFVSSPLLLLAPGLRRAGLPGFLLGGAALALAWPEGPSAGERGLLLALAVAGAATLAAMLQRNILEWNKSDRLERALSLWASAALLGVLFGHNYAAPRYLWPAALPLALLLGRRAPPRLAVGAAGLSALLSLALSRAEVSYAAAADSAARAVAAASTGPGAFTGEWSFRWRLEEAGWRFTAPGDPLPAGAVVAAPRWASPGPLETEGATPLLRVSAGQGRLRLLDAGVGYYAETLGPLPLGWRSGPLEEVVLWRSP